MVVPKHEWRGGAGKNSTKLQFFGASGKNISNIFVGLDAQIVHFPVAMISHLIQ